MEHNDEGADNLQGEQGHIKNEGADNLQGEQGHIKNPRNSMNIQGAQGVGIACARARARMTIKAVDGRGPTCLHVP